MLLLLLLLSSSLFFVDHTGGGGFVVGRAISRDDDSRLDKDGEGYGPRAWWYKRRTSFSPSRALVLYYYKESDVTYSRSREEKE